MAKTQTQANETTAQAEQRQRDIRAKTEPMYRGQVIESGDWQGADGGCLTLNFSNGAELLLTTGNLSNGILFQAAVHGLKQKLVDAAAIARDPKTGKTADIGTKYAAVKEVYDRLLSGQWNAERGDGTGSAGLLFQALCRIYTNKTPDELREWLDAKDAKAQAALRANPKIAEVIRTIQAERIGDKVDTDAMLDELT